MQNLIQFPKRKLTSRQKIGYFLLAIIEFFEIAYHKTNEYFGIDEHPSDRIWFYSFYSSMAVVCLFILIIQLDLAI